MARKKNIQKELDEIDKIYTDLTGGPAKPKNKKKRAIIWLSIAAVLVLVGGFCAYQLLAGSLFDSYLTMSDVTVAGIPLAGMTRAEAKDIMADTAYRQTDMVIVVEDTTITLTPAQMGVSPDWDAAINAAYRSGSTGSFDISPYLNLNEDVLKATVEQLGQQYNRNLQQTQCTVEGQAPSLVVGEETDDSQKIVLTVTKGAPSYGLDTEVLYQQILEAYSNHVFLVEGQCQIVEPEIPDAQAIFDQYGTAPVDAVRDEKTFEVTDDVYGYGFDVAQLQQQLNDLPYGETLTVEFVRLPAAVRTEDLRDVLYRDLLGSCKTPYSGSDNNNRNTNLRLACEAINGKIIYPGETFTYNYTLGERTKENGWKPAASYVNGLTVDTYGGGICQVSSTLYYCTLLADLEIVERWPHGFISSYMEPGMDASVSWNSGDFRFTNNTNYPIKIEAKREKGYVYVWLYGTDEKDYYVEMTHETIGSTKYATVYKEIKASENPNGYKDGQVLVTPYTGYTVKSFKNKYDKETKELLSTTQESINYYSKRDEVIIKIVSDTSTETTPEETVPGETVPEVVPPVIPEDPFDPDDGAVG